MVDRDEVKKAIKEYAESDDFKDMIKKWTQKTCKEILINYWKSTILVCFSFLGIIFLMLHNFNKSINNFANITIEMTKSIERLENKLSK